MVQAEKQDQWEGPDAGCQVLTHAVLSLGTLAGLLAQENIGPFPSSYFRLVFDISMARPQMGHEVFYTDLTAGFLSYFFFPANSMGGIASSVGSSSLPDRSDLRPMA